MKAASKFFVFMWSFTTKEECRLRVLENKKLRIFGIKQVEVTEGQGKLHNEGLHSSCSSCNIEVDGQH
jgi:hypothetical protein